jgi:hypothetical protein
MTAKPRTDSKRRRTPAKAASVPLRISEFVRWPHIATARARVAAGWYDRDDVKSRLVDALLDELKRR